MSTYRAGISSTILRKMANSRAYCPRPQAWNTPTARKSMHRKGWAMHMRRRNLEP